MTKVKKNPILASALDTLIKERENWDSGSFSDLFHDIKKQLMERILEREMETQLGYEKHGSQVASNRRNGTSEKTIITETGPVNIDIPRDREGDFEPILIPKHQRRFPEMDQKIITMYAKGMSVRDIQSTLEELYGVKASPELISEVTDEVSSANLMPRPSVNLMTPLKGLIIKLIDSLEKIFFFMPFVTFKKQRCYPQIHSPRGEPYIAHRPLWAVGLVGNISLKGVAYRNEGKSTWEAGKHLVSRV